MNREWIRCSEQLPPDNEPVLAVVWARGENMRFEGGYCFAEYCGEEGWFIEDWPELEIERVTHWMPLPEPPEGAEEVRT